MCKHFSPHRTDWSAGVLLLFLLILFPLKSFSAKIPKDFVITKGSSIAVCFADSVSSVAWSAFDMFAGDAEAVLSSPVRVAKSVRKADIICRLDRNLPREGFRLEVKAGRLHVTGADSHGVAYGLLEVSRLIGVSPWEWWADCRPLPRERVSLHEGCIAETAPDVAYRGIFINDEDWGILPWASRLEPEAFTVKSGRIKGAIGPRVNERIFQLLLRLRANYYWPAMHECSQPFFTIPGNREMAAKYGIYIGGSHCEPMACSTATEWGLRGVGEYNYVTNRDNVKAFWKERLEDVKDQEIVYTIGMRGVHDGAMQGVRTRAEKLKYLQMVIDDQIALINETRSSTHGEGSGEVPPLVFIPYKEVLETYHDGLSVPDDVTLMWTDDNYGYIRHFPDSAEASRAGGNGLYYHVSYWGRPHDYLWLSTLSPALLQQQMMEAYRRGIGKMWILNVGDIKPAEYQIEQFMELAWNASRYAADDSKVCRPTFLTLFGDSISPRIEALMDEFFALSAECKPEHLAGTRVEESDKAYWNVIRPVEGWSQADVRNRVERYRKISDEAESIAQHVPTGLRDAFFQVVKYPVQAAAQMNFKFLCPDITELAYDSICALTKIYNEQISGGKWNGIMDKAPRKLRVFDKITAAELPDYPETTDWTLIHDPSCVPFHGDSITIQVRLLPNHPVVGSTLAFSLSVDGFQSDIIQYQTYDRSEEWKRNVLRGYAVRTLTLPVNSQQDTHTVQFIPETQGVHLLNLMIKR